ncbi:MAG TPA: MFS transporter [Fibrobacteria bacterium]|nr:MFS transporter [Fibrobacteria bacterium]
MLRELPPVPRRIAWLHFLNDLSLDFLTPLLPAGVGVAWIGIMEGLADATGQLLKVASGRRSDATGRRVLWVGSGYAANAFARPLAAVGLALGWPLWVVVCRIGDRVGKGLRGSATDALVADWTEGRIREQAFNAMRVLDNLGATVGALLAALVAWLAPARIPWAVGLLVVPALWVAWLCRGLRDAPVIEMDRSKAAAPPTPGWWPRSRALQMPLLALALSSAGTKLSPLLVLLPAVGLSAGSIHRAPLWALCLGWAALGLVQTLAATAAGPLLSRLGAAWLLRVGWILGAVAFAGLAWGHGAWLWLAALGWGTLSGATEGAEKALLAELAPASERALSFGALALVSALGALAGSGLCGLGLDRWGAEIFSVPALLLIIGSITIV